MKEHPDYKYRPRRKPKPLMKKEPKFGFPISPLISPSMDPQNLSRSMMAPLSAASLPPFLGHHPDQDSLKIPRSLFPPLSYLYPFRHPEESKFAAELALLYSNSPLYPPSINWSINNMPGNVSSPCNICPSAFPRRTPSPEGIKRPLHIIMKNEDFRGENVQGHVI